MSNLLKDHKYYELPTTKRLIARCRQDIVDARLQLANGRKPTDAQRSQMWLLVDSREWFIRMTAQDYKAELELIDREIEVQLSR